MRIATKYEKSKLDLILISGLIMNEVEITSPNTPSVVTTDISFTPSTYSPVCGFIICLRLCESLPEVCQKFVIKPTLFIFS